MSDEQHVFSSQEHLHGMVHRLQDRLAPAGVGAAEKGLWFCTGGIVLEDAGDFDFRVAVRLLYPPATHWGHVLFSGKATGNHNLSRKFAINGYAFLYRSADELVSLGELDVSVNAGSFEVGGAHVGFTKGGEDIGFFVGVALFVNGSAQGTGKGSFC